MTADELRAKYLKFFEDRGHKVMPSSSLIPQGDPTLLLTSAGMVQFKPYFTGEAKPPAPRLATCQKCFRTTDVERVGNNKHLTFFEMLGNFSIGDYFKKEAIPWAWEFVTEHLNLPKEKLWATIFLTDDESYGYWRALNVPEDRIVRLGEKDNFWGPAGETGPCGPCSEIHYDFGAGKGCGRPDCNPGCGCGRFIEVWNLVFTEYYQDARGKRTPLPRKNIDTGMGLERALTVVQGKNSFYDTDIFAPLIEKVCSISGKTYGRDEMTDRAMRIVVEHGRGIAFLIADGIVLSNEGRGYVLRRVMRRAALFGRSLGLEKPFLGTLAKEVIARWGHIYPELKAHRDLIQRVIGSEETKFGETVSMGLSVFENKVLHPRQDMIPSIRELQGLVNDRQPWAIVRAYFNSMRGTCDEATEICETLRSPFEKLKAHFDNAQQQDDKSYRNAEVAISEFDSAIKQISGKELFKLRDTYGFPPELTAEIASESGLTADMEGFKAEMERQRERARSAHKFLLGDKAGALDYASRSLPPSEFVGYKSMSCRSTIISLAAGGEFVDSVQEGQEVEVVLDGTPFYAEMGGQAADVGEISGRNGRIAVTDTRASSKLVIHKGKVAGGVLMVKDRVLAAVDRARRLDIARNHTATHLLHSALRQVLGNEVRQMGSMVAAERFRFDFSFQAPVLKEELAQVQRIVNDVIRQNLPVTKKETTLQQAVAEGAIALFGEKYGDVIRVVKVGSAGKQSMVSKAEPFSMEVCGGTHVDRTGDIGFFQVLTEGSIGSGLRRIEAVTGRGAEELIGERLATVETMAQQLQTTVADLQSKVTSVLAELDSERKRAQALERQLSQNMAESLLARVEHVDGVAVLAAKVTASNMDSLKYVGDLVKDRLNSGVIVLGAVWDDRPSFVAMVTPDLVSRGLNAGDIVKKVSAVTGGGGGGRPSLGQGGGKDKDKIDQALKLAPQLVQQKR